MEDEPLGNVLEIGEVHEALRIAQVIGGPRGDRDHNEAASKPPSSRTVGEPPRRRPPLRELSFLSPRLTFELGRVVSQNLNSYWRRARRGGGPASAAEEEEAVENVSSSESRNRVFASLPPVSASSFSPGKQSRHFESMSYSDGMISPRIRKCL